MNLNVLRPGNSVKSAFESPGVLLALVLVIIPSVFAAISYFLNGADVEWDVFAWEFIAKKYILFFVLAFLIFISGKLLNQKKQSVSLKGIISALGLIYVIAIIMAVLSLFSRLLFSQEFFSAVQEITAGNVSTEEFAISAQLIMQTMSSGINWILLIVFVIIGLVLLLWQTIILYKIFSFANQRKPWLNIIALIIGILVIGGLSFLI